MSYKLFTFSTTLPGSTGYSQSCSHIATMLKAQDYRVIIGKRNCVAPMLVLIGLFTSKELFVIVCTLLLMMLHRYQLFT